MANFGVYARKISDIQPIEGADRIEVAQVEGYQVVVGKGNWNIGDWGLYIPEQAVLPQELLIEMDLVGKLAGSNHDRVKAIKLRGVISQGLIYPWNFAEELQENVDYSSLLDIHKYEAPIPVQLAGQVQQAPRIKTILDHQKETINSIEFRADDLENLKDAKSVFEDGEWVVATEKLDGTQLVLGVYRDSETGEFETVVSSKGITGRGLSLKEDPNNTYWKAVKRFSLDEKLVKLAESFKLSEVWLYGEIIGVQKLHYGLKKGDIDFYAFDLKVPETVGFISVETFFATCEELEIKTVPVVYEGPYSYEKMYEFANMPYSTLYNHIREGIAIRPLEERENRKVGRVAMKLKSDKYSIGDYDMGLS